MPTLGGTGYGQGGRHQKHSCAKISDTAPTEGLSGLRTDPALGPCQAPNLIYGLPGNQSLPSESRVRAITSALGLLMAFPRSFDDVYFLECHSSTCSCDHSRRALREI